MAHYCCATSTKNVKYVVTLYKAPASLRLIYQCSGLCCIGFEFPKIAMVKTQTDLNLWVKPVVVVLLVTSGQTLVVLFQIKHPLEHLQHLTDVQTTTS